MKLSAEAQRRLEHLLGLFEREGARLHLTREHDGAWLAVVRKGESEPAEGVRVRAWTPVEAAEVAWLKFHDALDLRGDIRGMPTL